MIAYTLDGSAALRHRSFTGSEWSAQGTAPNVVGQPKWVVTHDCPTREEIACLTHNSNKRVYLMFFDGSSWSAPSLLCSAAGVSHKQRACDAVYEKSSGDLLVAYWSARLERIGYRTYSGASISDESTLALTGASDVEWVTLVADPGSDEALLLALDSNQQLFAAVWSGSAFGTPVKIGNSLQTADYECYSASYEAGTGTAVIVYSQSGTGAAKHRIVSEGAIGAQQNGPTLGSNALNWIRAASSPSSEQVVFVALNSDKALYANAWGGSSWGTSVEVASSLESNDKRGFDIASEPTGSRIMLSYAASGVSSLRCRLWTGSSWGGVFNGPAGDGTIGWIALAKGSADQTIGVGILGLDQDLTGTVWNGTTFVSTSEVCAIASDDDKVMPLGLCFPGSSGGTGPLRVTQWREVER